MIWDETLGEYDFGPGHPMDPVRLALTAELAGAVGLLDGEGVRVLTAPVASEEQLLTVHSPDYLDAVRSASASEGARDPALLAFGIGGDDVPAFPGMHTASARVVGGALAGMDEILSGRATRAVHVAGGMHHAHRSSASGFCVYNDASIAIRRALDAGEERVLYVDVDVHHGDGVERSLWDEPRAITLSFHESGEHLFPGTGFVQDSGGAGAAGTAVNVPLPPRTDADGWVRAIGAVLPALARAVRPTLLVTQHGADTHREDPLADLSVTLEAQREVMLLLRELADELCGGRWLALGGGGYSVIDVVPRSWVHLIAVGAGREIDTAAELPAGYRELAEETRRRYGLAPRPDVRTYGDGQALAVRDWSAGFDPEQDLDRAVQAARRAVFPEWGLDPYLD